MPYLENNSDVNSLVKEVPKYDCSSLGKFIQEKMLNNASIILMKMIFSTDTASGYFNAKEIEIIKYLFPF